MKEWVKLQHPVSKVEMICNIYEIYTDYRNNQLLYLQWQNHGLLPLRNSGILNVFQCEFYWTTSF